MDVILKDDEITRLLTLWAVRSGIEVDSKSFELGRMSVALMLESQARIFESLEGTSLYALNKIEIAVALRTLLRSLKIDDDALDVYESVTIMKAAEHITFEPALQHGDLSPKEPPSPSSYESSPVDTPASYVSEEYKSSIAWPATVEEKAAVAEARRRLAARTDGQDSRDESEHSQE